MRSFPNWVSRVRLARLVLVFGAAATSACSMLLEWELEQQRCGEERACVDGYSCLGTVCVGDHSVAEEETCVGDRQCAEGLICTPQPRYVCRKPCDGFLVPTAACGTDGYCRPSPSPEDGTPRGSCVASECNEDADCEAGLVCVRITDRAGACLAPCTYSVSSSGAYGDQCRGANEHCQPLGIAGSQRVVCLRQSEVTQVDYGAPCDHALLTCGPGAACTDGRCLPFCDPTSGHPCCAGANCPAECLTTSTELATFSYCRGP